MTIIPALIFFILGLIIGSFLNVVIIRYRTQRSFGGRSACMACLSKLSWLELVPVFSFLSLGGRCKSCKTKISIAYPLVEILTGLIFASLFFKFETLFFESNLRFAATYAYFASIFSLLLVIAVYDLKHKIIPDMLALFTGVLSFAGLFLFLPSGFYPHIPGLMEFLAGPIVALPFALVWLLSRGRWMGLGDAKLLLSLGWLLRLGVALSGLVIAFWSGAIVGLFLIMFSKKHGIKSEIPFAPFLVLGFMLVFLFGLNVFPV